MSKGDDGPHSGLWSVDTRRDPSRPGRYPLFLDMRSSVIHVLPRSFHKYPYLKLLLFSTSHLIFQSIPSQIVLLSLINTMSFIVGPFFETSHVLRKTLGLCPLPGVIHFILRSSRYRLPFPTLVFQIPFLVQSSLSDTSRPFRWSVETRFPPEFLVRYIVSLFVTLTLSPLC